MFIHVHLESMIETTIQNLIWFNMDSSKMAMFNRFTTSFRPLETPNQFQYPEASLHPQPWMLQMENHQPTSKRFFWMWTIKD